MEYQCEQCGEIFEATPDGYAPRVDCTDLGDIAFATCKCGGKAWPLND